MSARPLPRLSLALALLVLAASATAAHAQQKSPARDELDSYLSRLVTEMRADVPDLERYEPVVVLHVLHDERGYRVQASDLLERRLTDALAAQGVRVIDPMARQRILDGLEACYTDEAPFCRASDVVGRFQTAGGILEGSVLPVRGGTELRLKLVVAAGSSELSPGEILGTWSVVVPPPSLDPVSDLLPAAGVVAFGRLVGDSVSPEQLGELRVDVRTQDGTQAWVRIDERIVAPAPVTTTTAAGRHLLTVTAAGHRPFSGYAEVPPRGIVRREIILERGVGSVRVTSNAREATVYLDGRRVGATPWWGEEIETGPHGLRVEKDGFVPFATDFVLEHQENKHVAAELTELPGDIVISCLHDDMTVFMDDPTYGPVGKCSTRQSLTVTDVSPGTHRLWGARGPDRTATTMVTVRGGQTVPISLALRLDLPPEVREANERRANRQYEPFGGRRQESGPYVSLGLILGQAKWDMTLTGSSGSFNNVNGRGGRLALSWFAGTWDIALGGDYVLLDDFGDFENGKFWEIDLGVTGHLLPGSRLRPFAGVRVLYNALSFDDKDPDVGATRIIPDPKLTGSSFGVGAHAGVDIRLSRRAALQLGASYSRTAGRDIEGDTRLGNGGQLGNMEDWQFVSGFAAVAISLR